jgi:hypothetical protein
VNLYFQQGLFQKTVKVDQNDKLSHAYLSYKQLQKVPEDTRSHATEADLDRMRGGAVSLRFESQFSTALRIASSPFIQVGLIRGLRIDALAYIY